MALCFATLRFTALPDDWGRPGRPGAAFPVRLDQGLHALRYASGVYSNSLSGISDLVSNYASPSYAMPDVIYDALWNGVANTRDPAVPSTDWPRHQRIHQYLGGQNVTYGGDTINIDRDYLDVQRPALAGGTAQASPRWRRLTA